MAKRSRSHSEEERLKAFAARLNRLMLAKGWSGAELAREASKFVPKGGKTLGRHLISAYSRADNEPTDTNLSYISKALGVKADELLPPLPGEGDNLQYATATSGLDGKTRLVVDAQVEPEVALKVLQMIRQSTDKKRA